MSRDSTNALDVLDSIISGLEHDLEAAQDRIIELEAQIEDFEDEVKDLNTQITENAP